MTPQAKFAALSLILLSVLLAAGCDRQAQEAPTEPPTPEQRALEACQEVAGGHNFQFHTGMNSPARGFTCTVTPALKEEKSA